EPLVARLGRQAPVAFRHVVAVRGRQGPGHDGRAVPQPDFQSHVAHPRHPKPISAGNEGGIPPAESRARISARPPPRIQAWPRETRVSFSALFPVMRRYLIPILLALAGAALAWHLGMKEFASVKTQLTSFPDSDAPAHRLR